ncbi:hypothetical protein GCM10012275_43430 [Longimycelium tulufanense]|uniref:Lantibiotic dehydratase n=1 Tax=Longimycelium tulufanense TaxID=907463 RepID=A0A8J3FWP6_9PSEU|nr:lantibiotic dehydratase [Longimycelium tulufanense]GGM68212.1 hypothetical protein GCM10012275_43430 [Longimycelium tulufanense]
MCAQNTRLYRSLGVGLLRATAAPLTDVPEASPELTDTASCRIWLGEVWCRPGFTEAIEQASPSLASRVEAILDGSGTDSKQIRRATIAVLRYLLRAVSRPTPFGLFAGVAPAVVGSTAGVWWGDGHRVGARPDTEWLAEVIAGLEAVPDLLERLDVVWSDLVVRRGDRLEVPQGPNRASIRNTSAVAAVADIAAAPIPFGDLADKLTQVVPGINVSRVRGMLTELVRQGYLITALHAPFTVTDPLTHVLNRLRVAGAENLPSVVPLLRDLEAVRAELHRHNHPATGHVERRQARTAVTRRLSSAGRIPLAIHLLLDCHVQVPYRVAREMEQAASVLLRLTRHPHGDPAWRDYHAAFLDRYGVGALVPLVEVANPDAGLGFPAGYPGSLFHLPPGGLMKRDERLLALAWQTVIDGSREVVLSEEQVRGLAAEGFDEQRIPPHVELSARIHAPSTAAAERGDFVLTVAPGRAAGTLTGRFAPLLPTSALAEAYRALPTATEGALSVQLSFPPAYPHAENVARVPAYLDHVLPVGEHRGLDDQEKVISVGDLAVTATRDRLHAVSLSRRRVVEPQVFHALALDKQPPPLARFLAHLPRASVAAWHEFDWGPGAQRLPFLPRVRYQRSILSPARWRLTTSDLPSGADGQDAWRRALDSWRHRWGCPTLVELRDADRTLRLDLDEPAHLAILRAHLARHEHVLLTEAAPAGEFGWGHGHAHQVVFPLATVRGPAPNPLRGSLPVLGNAHGQLPGSAGTEWFHAKLFTHPERMDEILTAHLPELLESLGNPSWWFVRYRSPHEANHLRLRLHVPHRDHYAACAVNVGDWAQWMREKGILARLVIDTYVPETGRYGAMRAAEQAFAADSRAVATGLRHLSSVDSTALVAAGMVHVAQGFFGEVDGMCWLLARPASNAPPVDRTVTEQAIRLAVGGGRRELPGRGEDVDGTWQARTAALATYRAQLPAGADLDTIVESLLHLHHNRAHGIDPDHERTCRRLARQAALTWRARQAGGDW